MRLPQRDKETHSRSFQLIKIGKLRHRIAIEQVSETQDTDRDMVHIRRCPGVDRTDSRPGMCD